MKEITSVELKKNLLQMLQHIDAFCIENNIRYTMVGGTLLGAVRHKGFIPWDDDIDIAMKRSDYNRFIKLFHNSNERYDILTNEIDNEYYHPFAKVIDKETYLEEIMFNKYENLGIYIDIFPVDKIDKKMLKMKVNRFKILYNLNCLRMCNDDYYRKKSFFKKTIRQISKLHSNSYYIKKLNHLAQEDNNKKCDFCGMIMSGQGIHDVMPINIFDRFCLLEFENNKFMAIENYDLFLKKTFGDYMKLPPVSKRNSVHNFKAYKK